MVVSSRSRVVFAVPVDRAQAAVVRQTVRQLLEAAGFPDEAAEDVIVAVGEAYANAVVHGSGSRREQVGVSAWAHRRHVAIELRYPGEPFDTGPPAVPLLDQLTGRGRYLMAALMDSVTYTFPPGETLVRLEKSIKGALECYRCYCRVAVRAPPHVTRDVGASSPIRQSRGRRSRRVPAASSMLGVPRKTVRRSSFSSWNSPNAPAPGSASRFSVRSSISERYGWSIDADAIATRRVFPPESCDGRWFRRSVGVLPDPGTHEAADGKGRPGSSRLPRTSRHPSPRR
jgi:anti-sigma regulatory factor (Ser/Thr protein kinase)